MSTRVVERGGSGDAGEAPDEVVPEECAQRLSRMRLARDREQPRSNDERLEEESGIQLPATQLLPAPLPEDQRQQRERRHEPAGRALRHEANRGPKMHERVAAGFGATGSRGVAAPGTEQRERGAGQ